VAVAALRLEDGSLLVVIGSPDTAEGLLCVLYLGYIYAGWLIEAFIIAKSGAWDQPHLVEGILSTYR
jgi:hypothetical protein